MKRDIFSMALDFGHELAVDNFAGGGEASTGIALGLGREVGLGLLVRHEEHAQWVRFKNAAKNPTGGEQS